jgi:hypothetical protein
MKTLVKKTAISLALILVVAPLARAQPTYKLEVRTNPQASLTLEGTVLKRSAVKDDPGFRLQYHIQKDGKTVAAVEARAQPTLNIQHKEAGTYTVVLEVFYPAYKGGNAQKGKFQAISNVVTYRYTPGAKPTIQIVIPPAPVAALVILCGKGMGKAQDTKATAGYGYKLLQGTLFDGWPAGGKTHCWTDPKEVRFEITLPTNAAGTLRLFFLDGDKRQRKQKLLVQGQPKGDIDTFAGAGKQIDVLVGPADAKAGKIEVRVQNLNPAANAVVSSVEFLPKAQP